MNNIFTVNGRELYTSRGGTTRFLQWAEEKINQFSLKEGVDYIQKQDAGKTKRGIKNYYFTELNMLTAKTYSTSRIADKMNMNFNVTKLNKLLAEKGIQYKNKLGFWELMDEYKGNGYTVHHYMYDEKGKVKGSSVMRWTEKGHIFIYSLFGLTYVNTDKADYFKYNSEYRYNYTSRDYFSDLKKTSKHFFK